MKNKPLKTGGVKELQAVANMIASARSVAVLTGAGVSKESGIPTFRDAQTGLWAKYDPQQLATTAGFKSDPGLVWRWYDYRRQLLASVEPNNGHYALVELEGLVPKVTVVTQNVDGLHQKAGSHNVIELHGSITSFFCFDKRHPAADVAAGLSEPPRCHCGSLIRPAVVWFGEMLPEEAFDRASEAMFEADVILVIGTSGLVQPAASLPLTARLRGAKIVEINPERTPIAESADAFLEGPSGQILPQLVEALKACGKR